MKNLGENKTLFQSGSKLKWANHYDKCIKCGTCNFKHKGNGFCTSCYDKKRSKGIKRRMKLRENAKNWAKKTYIPKNYENNDVHKKWYEKNRDILCLIQKGRYALKTGKPTIQIYNRHIPYMELVTSKTCSYEQCQINLKLFDKVKKYIENVNKALSSRVKIPKL